MYPQHIGRDNMLLLSHYAIMESNMFDSMAYYFFTQTWQKIPSLQFPCSFETDIKTCTDSLKIDEDGSITVIVHHGKRVHPFNCLTVSQLNVGDHVPIGGGVCYLK